VGPDRLQLTVIAAISAATVIFICVLFIATSWAAANGRLRRNQYVGIRSPSTMRSDQAWVAAHRAALRLTPLYLIITAIACAALVWAALYAATPAVVIIVGLGGFGALVAVLIYSSIIAGKAAKSAGGQPDDRRRQ
jgi:SdpI/YfhL protein family